MLKAGWADWVAGWLGWLGVLFVASHARGIYESKIFVFQAWARDLGSFWGQLWSILDHLGNLGPPWILLWATWEQPGTAILGKPSPHTNKSIFMPSHDSWDVFGEHVSGDAGYENTTKKNQVVDICLDISCHDHWRLVEQDVFFVKLLDKSESCFYSQIINKHLTLLTHHLEKALEISQSLPTFRGGSKQFFATSTYQGNS